jgi:adenylate cyclase class 2
MCIETEAKFPVTDFEPVRKRIAALGGVFGGRVFEENVVFDDAGCNLREKGVLLRLRRDRDNLFTVKCPPEATGGFAKSCREIETRVEDFEAMHNALKVLGFSPAFRYEKVRETWDLQGCHICLDEVSFGLFVEMEGGETDIARTAESLGLDLATASDRNYHVLNLEHRRGKGLPPQDGFTFSRIRREEILRELAEK